MQRTRTETETAIFGPHVGGSLMGGSRARGHNAHRWLAPRRQARGADDSDGWRNDGGPGSVLRAPEDPPRRPSQRASPAGWGPPRHSAAGPGQDAGEPRVCVSGTPGRSSAADPSARGDRGPDPGECLENWLNRPGLQQAHFTRAVRQGTRLRGHHHPSITINPPPSLLDPRVGRYGGTRLCLSAHVKAPLRGLVVKAA